MFFFCLQRIESGKENKNAYQTGVKKNKRVAYPCLTWKTTFLHKNLFKKVYNFIIISRLPIYLLTVDLICKPKGCNCL